ncbi:alpha/beta fold hydrolase [Terrimonas pollutisoli]|uniref:alpha/beta fold hydrolase n=1 Tax=Terrimonas pollutisoli TaxID=3034147 RepID=UPI0023EDE468|nr:alpha/beta fold hydrolase [Terrimonas sp. H1YJ31]
MQHLLLLHGAIGAKDQLQSLADELSDYYIIHTLNFSGHGGEPFHASDFSIPVFAGDVVTYLKENNIRQTNIFGYSMGGYVALYLVRHSPILVNRVITLATKFQWNPGIATKEAAMLNADTIEEKVPAFAEQLQQRHYPNDWKIVLQKTKQLLVQLGDKNDLQLNDYQTILTPSLLLLGDKDKMVTPEETAQVEQALPNGKFQLLENTPHPLEKVDVKMLGNIIHQFLG